MIWSLKRALPKIWRAEFIENDVSHILSTGEEFFGLCEQIETQEAINRQNKNSKSTTGYSGNKLVSDIGRSSSMTHSEGLNKVNNNQIIVKCSDWLLHGTDTHDTNNYKTLSSQSERMKQTYVSQDKTKDQ